MAQGCINILVETDIENMDKKDFSISKERSEARELANSALQNLNQNKDNLNNILSNKDNREFKRIDRTLKIALNSKDLKSSDSNKLVGALKILNKNNPSYTGLFSKVNRKGHAAMSHGYELIATSAIISKSKTGGIKSSLGKSIKILETDKLDFGAKHDSDYTTKKGNKGTVESDTLISRGTKEIGIDFKYSKTGKAKNLSSNKEFHRQLEGLKSAMNDGQLQEFHFVSNNKFTSKTKEVINKTNIELIKSFMNEDKSNEYSKYESEVNKVLSINKTSLDKCHNNSEIMNSIQKINDKYEVPQIGVSEDVNL